MAGERKTGVTVATGGFLPFLCDLMLTHAANYMVITRKTFSTDDMQERFVTVREAFCVSSRFYYVVRLVIFVSVWLSSFFLRLTHAMNTHY